MKTRLRRAAWASVGLALFLGGAVRAAIAETWDGPKNKSVPRQEVYEFARKPTFAQVKGADGQPMKDRYEVRFASKAACDVAVCIQDAGGRIVRHIVYGVLGANAPAPLRPDSLDQTLAWDGKDEGGKYVKSPETCTARVSLGLNPTFDRILGYHPKDSVVSRNIGAIAADADGVYVLEISSRNQLRKFDHKAGYVRTLVPYAADQWNNKQLDLYVRQTENGRAVPQLTGMGGTAPFAAVANSQSMAAAAGKLGFYTVGEQDNRRLLRLRTDGTTGGEPMDGATFGGKYPHPDYVPFNNVAHIALSPDGKWVYVSGLSTNARGTYGAGKPYRWNAVYRFPWDWDNDKRVVSQDSFAGEVSSGPAAGAGDDNQHFNWPEGMACDPAGRLYVCDFRNNRIQILSAAGKHLKTIGIANPREIAIHQKTGEIYLLCYPMDKLTANIGAGGIVDTPIRLVKLGPFEDPQVRMEKVFKPEVRGDPRSENFWPVLCVDSWSTPTRLWLVTTRGQVRVYNERDKDLELFDDFEKDVAAFGLRPHMLGHYKMNRLAVDPIRNVLYYLRIFSLQRCDPEGLGKFEPVEVLGGIQEMDFSREGLFYARPLKHIARFNPDKAIAARDGVEFGVAAEVPFDYGEGQDVQWRPDKLRGVIPVNALPGANGFDTGIGVGVKGDIIAFMKYYTGREGFMYGRENSYYDANVLRAYLNEAKDFAFRPRQFPGRHFFAGELVMRWNSHGELIGEDLVPSLPMPSCGIRTDRDGNIYCGIGANMYVNGKKHTAGALGKFAPAGAKFYGKGDVAKLEALPDRPPEFCPYGWGDIWTQNMFWAYPGYDQMHFLGGSETPCLCSNSRFDMDGYGRSFVPKGYQYCVGVLDTNGNVICEIGRFGNPESPAMKKGDTDIGIAHCSFLATESDKWLYINDDGNSRVIRVQLGYHKNETVALETAGR